MVSLSKIDAVEEYISSLIQNKQENEFVDFKQFYYHEDKKYDLIKDIVSFSNEVTSVDKYIVFGIINGSWEPAGINLSTMPDVSVINDLLHTYVEPFIYVEIGQMKYNGKDLGYIKIPVDRADRPYVIKKEYSKHGKTYLRYGEIYVRKGANNFIATRRDLDHIYRNNGAFLISVFDSTVDIGFVQIRNERKLFIQVRTILANNTSHSINTVNYSPLRYPGGKSRLAPFISLLIQKSKIETPIYVEPFAGGAGVALSLLLNSAVDEIVINDYDKAIYSVWRALLTETDSFIKLIEDTPLSVDEWRARKRIYDEQGDKYSLELGFAAFYLNRTNHSGILSNAGPIGGFDQTGNYLIDARFNRPELVRRVCEIAKYKSKIHLYNKDIRTFLEKYLPKYQERAFIYFDPPLLFQFRLTSLIRSGLSVKGLLNDA